MDQSNQYKAKYSELKVIGSGNFGSATLISPRNDPTKYLVAKKVLLGKIDDSEKKSAKQEAELLKQLKHPHIVEYVDSFIEDGFFIIVMEYCEEGDLAYHIKKMREKRENFSEELIMNWFLQILFALGFIHSKKILHRDIKASNIFLTSHGFVKLGDFGISKILEGTMENADTVIGTPYYMSPEVCENIPYSFKSDVWALGCVIYELCTLKHAFSANNLLGLVYKIIQEKQEPIPSVYSSNLRNLVSSMLTKNHKDRPDTFTLLNNDFVREVGRCFIEKKGELTTNNFSPVIKRTELHLERQMEGEEGPEYAGKTPKEKAQIRKQQEIQRQEQMHKKAILENRSQLSAKDRKRKDMQSSLDAYNYTSALRTSSNPSIAASARNNGLAASTALSRDFEGDATIESNYEATVLKKTKQQNLEASYRDYPTQTINSMNLNTQNVAGQIVSAANQASNPRASQQLSANRSAYNGVQLSATGSRPNYPTWEDNRPIRGSGTYDINSYDRNYEEEEAEVMGGTLETMELTSMPIKKSATPARKPQEHSRFDDLKTQDFYDQKLNEKVLDCYPDDFEEVEDSPLEEFYPPEATLTRLTQKKGNKEMLEVMDEYKRFLTNPQEYQVDNTSHFSDVPTGPPPKNPSAGFGGIGNSQRLSQMKENLEKALGPKVFKEVFDYYVSSHRKNIPEAVVHNHMRQTYDKKVLQHLFSVEQYVFFTEQYN